MTHSHHHAHHAHHDHHGHSSFNKAFAISVTLNFTFTLAEVIYALLAHSMSLLADAAHNFGDVFGLVLAWGANWLLSLSARKRYSYGFKRTTILAALTNALILVATSALITYESIYKLFHPADINEKIVIIVALLGIFINGGTALLFRKGAETDLNIKGAFTHLLADALLSFAVVIAGILIWLFHKNWIDPVAGLLIVMIILVGTWGLLRDSVNLILDAIPRYIDHHGIEAYLHQLPGVSAVHDLHIWGLSTKEVALTVHLIMQDTSLSDADYQSINHELKQKFKIDHATIQVESGSIDHPCERLKTC